MSYRFPRRISHMVSFCWRSAAGRVKTIAKAKNCNAHRAFRTLHRQLEEASTFIDMDDGEFKETIKRARKKLEIQMKAAMPCKLTDDETKGSNNIQKTKYARIVEAHESTRKRLKSIKRSWRSLGGERDRFVKSLHVTAQICSYAARDEYSGCESSSGQRMGEARKVGSDTVWSNGRISPYFCERPIEITSIWSWSLARKTFWSQSLKNWSRWTRQNSTPEGSMQRKC